MRLERVVTPFLVLAIVSGALAGCVEAPSGATPAGAVAEETSNPWERGLASYAETPEAAPRRSAAERESDVVSPGAPSYAAFDAAMEGFMASHQIPAASVAVLRNGKLRYENGYGHLDENVTEPTPPDAMFRIASVTKPMTAALVTLMVEEGRFEWDDPVFCLPPEPAQDCLLPIEPHPTRPVVDARLADVTLRDLVEHRTGWTRAPCTLPFASGYPIVIAHTFGIPSPPPAWRLAQWFMGTPMEFDPGTDPEGLDRYCNMGYVTLGLVAEAATGATLPALYEAYLFRPLGVTGDIEAGRGLPEHRNPREPFYACDGALGPNVYRPEELVCRADGGYPLEAILAAGGLVATAAAVGAVYEVYANDGSVRSPGLLRGDGHSGGLAGTATTARRLSVGGEAGVDLQVVVLFNKQSGHEAAPFGFDATYEYQYLHATLLAAAAAAEGAA